MEELQADLRAKRALHYFITTLVCITITVLSVILVIWPQKPFGGDRSTQRCCAAEASQSLEEPCFNSWARTLILNLGLPMGNPMSLVMQPVLVVRGSTSAAVARSEAGRSVGALGPGIVGVR